MPSSPCAHKPSALRAAVCRCRRSLPSAHHPPASRATSVERSACRLPTRHHPPANARRNIRRLPARHLPASSPCNARRPRHKPPANARHSICCLSASHPPSFCATDGGSLQAICRCTMHHHLLPPRRSICRLSTHHPLASGAASADASRCPHPPAHKPPARTDTLSPRENTFCAIVNCPLQIKPVFYFLFTSTAPPAHRIRVKSSLLRLRRSCLALPFTHLGKDIT